MTGIDCLEIGHERDSTKLRGHVAFAIMPVAEPAWILESHEFRESTLFR